MTKLFSGSFFRVPVSAAQIVALVKEHVGQVEFLGPDNLVLQGTCDSRCGGHGQLVFSTCKQYSEGINLTESLVLIDAIPKKEFQSSNQFCKVSDPKAVFMDVLNWLIATVGIDAHKCGFSNETIIADDADVATTAVIEPGVEIGAGSIVSAGAVIKTGTRIGKNAVIRENVVIGCNGVNVYRSQDGRLMKFPHVGGIYIGNSTEIGANSVIAGGILAPTSIGSNVIIGNLCNIGHGVVIEDGVWISVGTLIGGHTKIHSGATIAMAVSIRDNLIIGEEASIGMGTVVVKNVGSKDSMFGNPAKRMIGLKTGPRR